MAGLSTGQGLVDQAIIEEIRLLVQRSKGIMNLTTIYEKMSAALRGRASLYRVSKILYSHADLQSKVRMPSTQDIALILLAVRKMGMSHTSIARCIEAEPTDAFVAQIRKILCCYTYISADQVREIEDYDQAPAREAYPEFFVALPEDPNQRACTELVERLIQGKLYRSPLPLYVAVRTNSSIQISIIDFLALLKAQEFIFEHPMECGTIINVLTAQKKGKSIPELMRETGLKESIVKDIVSILKRYPVVDERLPESQQAASMVDDDSLAKIGAINQVVERCGLYTGVQSLKGLLHLLTEFFKTTPGFSFEDKMGVVAFIENYVPRLKVRFNPGDLEVFRIILKSVGNSRSEVDTISEAQSVLARHGRKQIDTSALEEIYLWGLLQKMGFSPAIHERDFSFPLLEIQVRFAMAEIKKLDFFEIYKQWVPRAQCSFYRFILFLEARGILFESRITSNNVAAILVRYAVSLPNIMEPKVLAQELGLSVRQVQLVLSCYSPCPTDIEIREAGSSVESAFSAIPPSDAELEADDATTSAPQSFALSDGPRVFQWIHSRLSAQKKATVFTLYSSWKREGHTDSLYQFLKFIENNHIVYSGRSITSANVAYILRQSLSYSNRREIPCVGRLTPLQVRGVLNCYGRDIQEKYFLELEEVHAPAAGAAMAAPAHAAMSAAITPVYAADAAMEAPASAAVEAAESFASLPSELRFSASDVSPPFAINLKEELVFTIVQCREMHNPFNVYLAIKRSLVITLSEVVDIFEQYGLEEAGPLQEPSIPSLGLIKHLIGLKASGELLENCSDSIAAAQAGVSPVVVNLIWRSLQLDQPRVEDFDPPLDQEHMNIAQLRDRIIALAPCGGYRSILFLFNALHSDYNWLTLWQFSQFLETHCRDLEWIIDDPNLRSDRLMKIAVFLVEHDHALKKGSEHFSIPDTNFNAIVAAIWTNSGLIFPAHRGVRRAFTFLASGDETKMDETEGQEAQELQAMITPEETIIAVVSKNPPYHKNGGQQYLMRLLVLLQEQPIFSKVLPMKLWQSVCGVPNIETLTCSKQQDFRAVSDIFKKMEASLFLSIRNKSRTQGTVAATYKHLKFFAILNTSEDSIECHQARQVYIAARAARTANAETILKDVKKKSGCEQMSAADVERIAEKFSIALRRSGCSHAAGKGRVPMVARSAQESSEVGSEMDMDAGAVEELSAEASATGMDTDVDVEKPGYENQTPFLHHHTTGMVPAVALTQEADEAAGDIDLV